MRSYGLKTQETKVSFKVSKVFAFQTFFALPAGYRNPDCFLSTSKKGDSAGREPRQISFGEPAAAKDLREGWLRPQLH